MSKFKKKRIGVLKRNEVGLFASSQKRSLNALQIYSSNLPSSEQEQQPNWPADGEAFSGAEP